MTTLLILDMDGLMIDSERVTYRVYQRVFAKYGREIPLDVYTGELVGRNIATIHTALARLYPDSFPVEQVLDEIEKGIAEDFAANGTPVKPGLTDLLDFARKSNWQIYAATSSNRDRVDKILSDIGVTGYFDGSVCGNEVSRGKPDPEIFQVALSKADVEAENAIVVEDSEMGIQAAHAAGIPAICVPDMIDPRPEIRAMCTYIGGTLIDVRDYLAAQKNTKSPANR